VATPPHSKMLRIECRGSALYRRSGQESGDPLPDRSPALPLELAALRLRASGASGQA